MCITQNVISRPVPTRTRQVVRRFLPVFALLAVLLGVGIAQAEGPDDDFLRIYGIIDQADTLSAAGKTDAARAKYLEAQKELNDFKQNNPAWNAKVLAYRQAYVATKLAAPVEKPATSSGGTSPAASKPAFQPPTVKLLEAGAEPRKVLRLRPKVGDAQSVQITIKMGMEIEAAGNSAPAMKMPPFRMGTDVKVTGVSPDGDITYEFTFGEGSVVEESNDLAPEVAEGMKAELASLKGATGTGVVTDRGLAKSSSFNAPIKGKGQSQQTPEQFKDALSQVALPEEAVGVGAKWEVTQKIRSQGLTIDQTETHEITALDGDVVTVKSVAIQKAAKQKLSSSAAPGMKMDLDKMAGKATGTTTLNLAKAVPTAGITSAHTEMEMSINIADQKQPMSMKMDMSSTVESK